MKLTLKTGALVGLMTTLLLGVGIVLSSSNNTFASAEGCQHVGNHYTGVSATKTKSGIREYWVCCKCHEHYCEKPAGSWTDAGTATITVDANDSRYIPKTNEYDAQGLKYSADGKTITGFDSKNGSKDIVIPEGITEIGTTFAGTNITSITIPSTVSTIDGGAFKNCTKLTSVIITEGVQEIESSGSWPTMSGAFQYCSALEYVVIPSTVTEMDGYAFASAKDSLKIYCVASNKPSGWSNNWNYKHQIGSKQFTVYWGLNVNWVYDANGVPKAK